MDPSIILKDKPMVENTKPSSDKIRSDTRYEARAMLLKGYLTRLTLPFSQLEAG